MAPANLTETVLILTPTGRDSELTSDMLHREGVPCKACNSVQELASSVGDGAALALLAEEVLSNADVRPLIQALQSQPGWSDFPVILLSSTGAAAGALNGELLNLFGADANVTILERPVRMATLLSTVRSALRARRRQYQVRDYLDERRRIDEQFLQTQKLESLGILAGGVAHDFNNLLTGILGNASLALSNLSDHLPIDGLLNNVIEASERAADLTRQLLAYSGKGKFLVQPIDLAELVQQISRLIKTSIPRTVSIEIDLADSLPSIQGDPGQMQQVIMNLIINGAEAIAAGETGNVTIRASRCWVDEGLSRTERMVGSDQLPPGNYVCLEVEDTGHGMQDETVARIFDPFFTTKFMGRGLGLAAVLGIVRSHKGGLAVRSQVGVGTTFKVLLPAMTERAVLPAPKEKKKLSGKGVILVVEDEEMVSRVAKLTLERYGYRVLTAENGEAGVAVFREHSRSIALVLLDLMMPVMGGEEAFDRMKAISPEVKVILSSGYHEADVIRKFEGRGPSGFLQKPYTAKQLAEKLAEVLRAPVAYGAKPGTAAGH